MMRKSSPCSAWCGCEREKVRHAWLVGGDSGRKFAMRGQNAPNWAILGEQGEFCIAHAVRRGVQGEFYTEVARRGSCWASFVSPWRRSCSRLGLGCHPSGERARGCWRALAICRVLWARSRPRAAQAGPWLLRSRASRDTTEAGPRRIPPLVACGARAVGAEKPAPETQCPSLSSETTATGASARTLSSSTSP